MPQFTRDIVFRAPSAQGVTGNTFGTVIDCSDMAGLVTRLRCTAKAGSGTPTLKVWFQARFGTVWYDMPTAGTQPNKWHFATLSNATGQRLLRNEGPIPPELRVRGFVAGGTGRSFTWSVQGSKIMVI